MICMKRRKKRKRNKKQGKEYQGQKLDLDTFYFKAIVEKEHRKETAMKNFLRKLTTAVFLITLTGQTIVWASDGSIWYEDNRVVAHALGAIEGRIETNSKEAFINAYENGYKVMEADFTLTSDGMLVVRHDFNQDSYFRLEQVVQNGNTQMDSNRYKNEKINFKYTPLTAGDLIQLLNQYEDVFLITDSKYTDAATVEKEFNVLINTAKSLGMTQVLDRFVIQIYNQDMYKVIKDIYPFDNWIFTLYQLQNPDYDSIGQFCLDNEIDVVTMNYEIAEAGNIKKLTDRGLKVYTHTVNRLLDYKKLLSVGCYGIYTDIIQPHELAYIGMGSKKKNGTRAFMAGKKSLTIGTYSIKGEEYVKLRDMAKMLEDTKGAFEVIIDDAAKTINLTTDESYTSTGSELLLAFAGSGIVRVSSYQIKVDGINQNIRGYDVDGQLYFKPEDLGKVLGFTVTIDENGVKRIQF